MLDKFAINVFNFNEIAGNNLDTSLASFEAQYLYPDEEVNKINKWLENEDVEEVLDAVVDTLYVAIGMLHKLKEMGIDVEEAMCRIGENYANAELGLLYLKEETDEEYFDRLCSSVNPTQYQQEEYATYLRLKAKYG